MADAKKADENEANAAPPKKKKLLLYIIIALLVLAIAGAGGAWFLLKKKKHAEDGDDEPSKDETKKDKHTSKEMVPPVFVKLEPFTVKLQSENQESYLQATPELRVADLKVGEQIKLYMPEIRHKVLLILSGKKSSDLNSPQGVERLSNEMRVTIDAVLDPSFGNTGKKKKKSSKDDAPAAATPAADAEPPPIPDAEPDDPVQAVLFTSFIVQ